MRWVTTSSRNKNMSNYCLANVDAIEEVIGTVAMGITHSSLFAKNVGQKHKAEQIEKQG